MDNTEIDFEQQIYNIIDSFQGLFSAELWENILLDCTKNELFVLWMLYRKKEANMSQIAEYIHAPLNTATGIITRMEKRGLVLRERSAEDKRIVTIRLGTPGETQIFAILKETAYYGSRILQELDENEIDLLFRVFARLIEVIKEEPKKDRPRPAVRRIEIE